MKQEGRHLAIQGHRDATEKNGRKKKQSQARVARTSAEQRTRTLLVRPQKEKNNKIIQKNVCEDTHAWQYIIHRGIHTQQ